MSSDLGASGDGDGGPRVNRLLTLSDGVIAIALTLLVLQLRVPSVSEVADPDSAADLAAQLGKGSAQLVSYGISFYVIAQFWLMHRQVFRLLGEHEESLEWWNFAFLATISIMPFTSTLLGSFAGNPLAVDIFALNVLIASLATQAMIVVGRRNGLLVSAARARAGRVSAAVVPVVMAVSIGLSWWSTRAAVYSWILMAVAPPVITRWSARQPHRLSQRHPRAGPITHDGLCIPGIANCYPAGDRSGTGAPARPDRERVTCPATLSAASGAAAGGRLAGVVRQMPPGRIRHLADASSGCAGR